MHRPELGRSCHRFGYVAPAFVIVASIRLDPDHTDQQSGGTNDLTVLDGKLDRFVRPR